VRHRARDARRGDARRDVGRDGTREGEDGGAAAAAAVGRSQQFIPPRARALGSLG